MLKKTILSISLFIVVLLISVGQESNLRITEPKDMDKVPTRPLVQGTVSDSTAKIWVIVKPEKWSDYWVQPKAMVKENGTWKTKIYIGEAGKHSGETFYIRAVANPEKELREGMKLSDWPNAQWQSQIVEVTKQ